VKTHILTADKAIYFNPRTKTVA